MITQKELKDKLTYFRDDGLFIHNKTKRIAGVRDGYGNIIIKINGKRYKAHRLAWLYEYGNAPENVYHINNNKADNGIDNLEIREVDGMETTGEVK